AKQNSSIETLTVDEISSLNPTNFSKDKKVYDLKLILGGDMERYIWHINGKAIYQDRNIEVKEGDVIRFTFDNQTMMHHPMHLHGHFFRVINKHGEHSPLKHTVDVPPHGSRTIEFYANEPGQWMLHCHNLYHMKSGMARVIKYTSYKPTGVMAEYDKKDPHLFQHMFSTGMLEAATNHAQAFFRVSRTWDAIDVRVETREYDNLDHIEGDLFYRQWFSNFLHLIIGGTYFSEYADDTTRGLLGIGYTFPLLIETQLLVDHIGNLRLDLEKKFQWTKHIYSDTEFTLREYHDPEFEVTLMYANSWDWSAGFMFTEDSVGVGAIYNF
ncbi:MAG: multicopper oxidase domain-containing protein, partial [Bdellovibrionales bacterium]|nr:multicopper oxidase domain-containing protein [Bdellovibrionales bacterium]